jgi:acetyl-CoA carboxylase carboxyl transferase subunit alpha
MLEYAYYSVISPEGCAAILWHDGTQAPQAAESLKLTAKELIKLGVIDAVIPEPLGGAHRNLHDTIYNVEQYLVRTLNQLKRKTLDELLEARYRKLRSIGEQCLSLRETKPQIPERLSAKAQIEKAAREAAEENIKVES